MEDQKHEYIFTARMNISYHEAMERWYSRWLNFAAFVAVIFSSAAFVAIISNVLPIPLQNETIFAISALFVTFFNAVVLAFNMLPKMTVHNGLKKKWVDFLSRTSLAETQEEMTKIEKMFHSINSEEPPPNIKRLNKCHAITIESMGLTTS